MSTEIRKFALAMGVISAMSFGALGAMTAPATAHTVCDDDGDDCYQTHPYYGRDWDHDWHERHEWEEQRQREAYRRWYWDHQPRYYGWGRPYSGTSLWFNF
jgi:hypothetical protein